MLKNSDLFMKFLCWKNGVLHGSTTNHSSACGGIFRNHESYLLLYFAENTGVGNAFDAGLLGAIRAIELAKEHHWNNLWLECDSSLVIHVIQKQSLVP
jgi:ribonuclease HI